MRCSALTIGLLVSALATGCGGNVIVDGDSSAGGGSTGVSSGNASGSGGAPATSGSSMESTGTGADACAWSSIKCVPFADESCVCKGSCDARELVVNCSPDGLCICEEQGVQIAVCRGDVRNCALAEPCCATVFFPPPPTP